MPKYFGSYINIVQSDMNVVLRKRNAIFISPFPAHFQQMSQYFMRILILIVSSLCLTSCSSGYEHPPIETPNAIFRVNPKKLPGLLEDWQYTEDFILLARYGYREEGGTWVALYEWSTGKMEELNLPEAFHRITQGPNNRIAYFSIDGIVKIVDVDQNKIFTVTEGSYPTFSPSGDAIALWQGNDLIIVTLADLSEEVVFHLQSSEVEINRQPTGTSWSPDGTLIAFMYSFFDKSHDIWENIMIVSIVTEKEILLVEGKGMLFDPAWSPDGRLIAYVHEPVASTSELRITDVQNQCNIASIRLNNINQVEWPLPGDMLAIIQGSRDLFFVDIQEVFGAPYYELECP
ncbi:MAG: hypothetical protein B6I38_07405 [Anaerolineaceae bacterium 4572_5.1]|nr:MAG: hypothetical protein B6I38_07405 [Anaerolineaceae bacterium 4572_5.1]